MCNFFQTPVDNVASKGSRIVHLAQQQIFQKVMTAIDESNTKEEIKAKCESIRQEVGNPFAKLGTAYLQKKYIERRFPLVKPVQKILGESVIRKRKHGEYLPTVVHNSFYYVPLHHGIQQLLKNEKLCNIIISQLEAAPEHFLIDVCDGTFYKEHAILGREKTLILMLYFDDFEVCNPLGSTSHKISMFYYGIANYPLYYRSKLCSINLLGVARRDIVDQYGVDKILEPFVHELQQLSEGQNFDVHGMDTLLYASLLSVVGDTPASNLLGGFKEGVGGAFVKCRQCYCINVDMQMKFTEEEFTLRTIASHLDQCNEIERAPTKYMKDYLSTLYGINRRSILTEVPEFDICKCMPLDLMHVFLEGVAQYEIKEVLKYHILQPRCTFGIQALNQRIKSFRYGYNDIADKPSLILPTTLHSEDNRIRQTAAQFMVFMKILPFLLDGLVDSDDVYVGFLRDLIDIFQMLIAPVITVGTLSVLKDSIKYHLNKFKELFPNLNIIPKQHYMVHFPSLIKRYGPPIRHWCMRFEAKHKMCKRIASKQNFANLPLSIAEGHQFSTSVDFMSDPAAHPMFANDLVITESRAVVGDDANYVKRKLLEMYEVDLTEVSNVHKSKHVRLRGITYICNETYIAAEAEGILPIFGLLRNIYSQQKQCIF